MTHPPSDHRPDSGVLRHAVMLGALFALLLTSWRHVDHTHRQRRATRSAALPERLQSWEGEGGRPDPQPATDGAAPTTGDTTAAPR